MDKLSRKSTSDQPKQTNRADSEKLQQHRSKTYRIDKAQEYHRSQRGETSESLYDTVFKIKDLVKQMSLDINNMAQHIRNQDKFINSSIGFNQSRQEENSIEQERECIARLRKAVSNEDGIKDWQNTREQIINFISDIDIRTKRIEHFGHFRQQSQKVKEGFDLNRQGANLIEQANKDIDLLDNAIKQVQLTKNNIYLENKLKETYKGNENLKLKNKNLRGQLERFLQETEKLRRDNQEHIELKEILKKAKLELPPEVKKVYNHLQDLHRKAMHGDNVSNDEHRKVFEELLGHLSPETLQDYKRRGVEFVANPDVGLTHDLVVKNAEGKWQLELPIPYQYAIPGMMLRTIDQLLATQQQQDGYLPPPERRIEIMAKVFRANAMLGEYGFPLKGYKLAEKYHKDFKDGIHQAFKDGRISKDDQEEKLTEIGHMYAYNQLLESIKPLQGIPRIFPSLEPGSYFERNNMWEHVEGQRPVKVGSPEFDTLMEKLKTRQQKRENSALTANILLNDAKDIEILVLPYYILNGLRSRHPMNAGDRHSVWAGEVDIDYETKTVTRLKDQSGHYRTFDKDHPYLMAQCAKEAFQELGYDTSTTMIELTAIEGGKHLEYKNYKPPTRGDLKDSSGRTKSEQYLDDFWKMSGTNEIKDLTQFWTASLE